MKITRWITAFAVLACCGVLSYAQVTTPPDGGLGLAGGHHSPPITSLASQNFAFSSCSGATGEIAAECAVFGGSVQEVFGGYNQTGVAWDELKLSFSGLNPADSPITCFSTPLFATSNCSSGLAIPASGSVTLDFTEGSGGMGIGCYASGATDPPVNGGANNSICQATSALFKFLDGFGATLPYMNNPANPLSSTCTGPHTVCGDNAFVIGIGVEGKTFTSPPTNVSFQADPNLPVNLIPTPEPQTLLMAGLALLGMVFLANKKKLLV